MVAVSISFLTVKKVQGAPLSSSMRERASCSVPGRSLSETCVASRRRARADKQ